jgi:flavin-dependent dehydrogenase
LLRSESDDLLFRHAGACGATIFDETKVKEIQFEPSGSGTCEESTTGDHTGKPVSATWVRKDGTSGSIKFDYLVDASGRQGILSTKYLKNRKFNDNFKNIANWSYWKSDNVYGTGTHMEGSPYFEALDGELPKIFMPSLCRCRFCFTKPQQMVAAGLGLCHYTMAPDP